MCVLMHGGCVPPATWPSQIRTILFSEALNVHITTITIGTTADTGLLVAVSALQVG